jgi:hypothetical protein
MEFYGRLSRPAMQLLQTLAAAAASPATAGSDVTTSSFVTGALRELSAPMVTGNEVVYQEALHVYATAGGTSAWCQQWTLNSFVPVIVCCVVVPDACHGLNDVDLWRSEL